ncbi:MAG: prenyltransferase/squalene oxidase repeat-containing protein [Acidimicrobiia bacterium]
MGFASEATGWLIDGDASISWQTMQDLLNRAPATVARERARVATTGWGKRLLEKQDAEGTWAHGVYGPKWISTTYTLLLLRRLGIPPNSLDGRRGCRALWDRIIVDGGVTWANTAVMPDVCVTAMFLALDYYFDNRDPRREEALAWMLDQQLPDGGWNCSARRSGSSHGSFHTTISVLEALAEIGDPASDTAAGRGREFFLGHRMYRSHRTGEVSHPSFTKLSFPPRWYYDVLRGLDYFRLVDAPYDERLDDALELLVTKRRKDGKWPVQNKHQGRVWFDMETGREPSRWNTLRALRVLDRYQPSAR